MPKFIKYVVRQYIVSTPILFEKFKELKTQGKTAEQVDNILWVQCILPDPFHRNGYILKHRELVPEKTDSLPYRDLVDYLKQHGWSGLTRSMLVLLNNQLCTLLEDFPDQQTRIDNVRYYLSKMDKFPKNITTIDMLPR